MALKNGVNSITFWLNLYNFVSTTCGIKNFITFWWYNPWCTSYWALCVGSQFKLHDMSQKTSRRKIIREGKRVTLLDLLSHSTFSFFESFAWPGNTTGLNALEMSDTCIIIVIIITYSRIFPLLLQSNLWIHFGLQKNVKSNGIYNSTRQKGCRQSQNGMLFHTWKTQKRFFISSAQKHRKEKGVKKNWCCTLPFANP